MPAADSAPGGIRPLSALLSQVLVAFTLEFDNEFERQMGDAGFPGASLSLVVWSNLIRFVTGAGIPVRDLAAQALAPDEQIKMQLGCLERWGFVVLRPDSADTRPIPAREHRRAGRMLRDGWGSARGIRSEWMVRLTAKGRQAREVWLPLFVQIEQRWQARFGDHQIGSLRQALLDIEGQLAVELPQTLPVWRDVPRPYPARQPPPARALPLPVLLAHLLLAFTIEFDRQSRAPLILCANILRVLGEQPVPEGEIPRLTGGSPEASGVGWRTKPYVAVEPDPAASRGKVVRLTPQGLRVQHTYGELVVDIERSWETRFGKKSIRGLRDCLRALFVPRSGNRLLLAEGLVPAAGTVRAGAHAPALGRRDIGAASRQRMRDLIAQTEMFLRDPSGALPHYPMWDMNRGFGP